MAQVMKNVQTSLVPSTFGPPSILTETKNVNISLLPQANRNNLMFQSASIVASDVTRLTVQLKKETEKRIMFEAKANSLLEEVKGLKNDIKNLRDLISKGPAQSTLQKKDKDLAVAIEHVKTKEKELLDAKQEVTKLQSDYEKIKKTLSELDTD